jgi:tetratricopeptide (TPR) repeat protein
MKHLYETNRPKPNELVAQYERLAQKGTFPSFCEKDFLSILDHYEQENNLENALTIINQALAQFKESGLLHLRKARILLYVKDIDKAFESLERAEIFGQPNLEISLLRVRAYCYREEYEVAKDMLNQLKIQHFHIPENISEVYTMEAFLFEKQEQYDQMFDALKEAILENPKNKEALGRVYFCVELSQKFHESVALHKQILDLDSYAFMAWFNLAHAYYALGEYKLALEAFDYAIVINEEFELAYLDCAELCYSLHIWDKALAHYQKLLELLEPDEELLCRIGECYQKLGDYEHAKIYLYRALAMSPKYAKVYYLIGLCYSQEGIWESSLHFFKQAVKLNPDRDDYLAALAKNQVMLGFPQRAIPLYKKATELGPEISTYWTELAQIYIERKKISQALELLDEALENTYDASLFYCQAACHFIRKDKSLALDTLREGLLEDYPMHHLLFELCPELREDADVKGILRYYASEFQ